MAINNAWYTSANDQYGTPPALFKLLNQRFGPFVLDACASPDSALVRPFYFTPDTDGLNNSWAFGGAVFCNPPYGAAIKQWMKKAVRESVRHGITVVCLVPARTDTMWWHTYVLPWAHELLFIKGRLRFTGAKDAAPFPSAIVVYRGGTPRHTEWPVAQPLHIPSKGVEQLCLNES